MISNTNSYLYTCQYSLIWNNLHACKQRTMLIQIHLPTTLVDFRYAASQNCKKNMLNVMINLISLNLSLV